MTEAQVDELITKLCTILGAVSGATIPLTTGQIGTIGTGLQAIAALVFLGISMWRSIARNTNTAVVQKAAAVQGTVVVTQPSIAAATPQQNIVSSAENSIVPAAPTVLNPTAGAAQ